MVIPFLHLGLISKSAIDTKKKAYFLFDPVNRGDTSYIIKLNLTQRFNTSSILKIKDVQGVTGISKW